MIDLVRDVVQVADPEGPYKVFTLSTVPTHLLIQEVERRVQAGAIQFTPPVASGSQRLVVNIKTHNVTSRRIGEYLIQLDVDRKDQH